MSEKKHRFTEEDFLADPEIQLKLVSVMPNLNWVENLFFHVVRVANRILSEKLEKVLKSVVLSATRDAFAIRDLENESLRAENEKLRAQTQIALGVGDGTGKLFVYGDYDSIKTVQAMIFENEKLEGE